MGPRAGRVLPPIAATIAFVDRINRGDVAGLAELMTADHTLIVFEEEPLAGRDRNVDAWRDYASAFPDYVIHPHRLAADGSRVAVLGHTTGSHLGLGDEEESAVTLIWVADVAGGLVRTWRLVEDSAANRASLGLDRV